MIHIMFRIESMVTLLMPIPEYRSDPRPEGYGFVNKTADHTLTPECLNYR